MVKVRRRPMWEGENTGEGVSLREWVEDGLPESGGNPYASRIDGREPVRILEERVDRANGFIARLIEQLLAKGLLDVADLQAIHGEWGDIEIAEGVAE